MTTPNEAHSKQYLHINGSPQDLLDRLAVSELCKGWPSYRDNSEWMNYRSLFTDDAYVWTTWSGPRQIDDFIAISKHGKANGSFIAHRENGTAVDLAPSRDRALGKMKATITQRFSTADVPDLPKAGVLVPDGAKLPVVYDVDCDCRFLFFCERVPVTTSTATAAAAASGSDAKDEKKDVQDTEWKVRYVKLFYEKDKLIPIDGVTVPRFADDKLALYPEGYKYLGVAQASLGYEVDQHLATLDQRYWGKLYGCMERWLDGEKGDVGLFWEGGEKEKK